MAQVAERLVTPEEFAAMPDPRHGGKLEYVRGTTVVWPVVGPIHGACTATLATALHTFVSAANAGVVRLSTGYWLGGRTVLRGPDISFGAADSLQQEKVWLGAVDGRPDLAVEVIGPDDLDSHVAGATQDYVEAGVPRVWVVRPFRRTVTVHRGGLSQTYGTRDTLTSDDAGFAAEGFALALADLFETATDRPPAPEPPAAMPPAPSIGSDDPPRSDPFARPG